MNKKADTFPRGPLLITLIVTALLVLTGCENCDAIKTPELLFDGGSVVFSLGSVDHQETHLMISPVKEQGTDGMLGPRAFKVYLVEEQEKGRFVGQRELLTNSQKEKEIVRKLQKCRDHFIKKGDPWSEKVQKLMDLIEKRTGPPPKVTYW